MTELKYAFVGLGNMGAGMAAQLASKQFQVTGFDLRPEPIAALVEAGGKGADTAERAAQNADVLIIMTINDAQARAILFDAGALKVLAKDATVVLTSTVSPDAAASIAKEITESRSGVGFIDAPVSGGTPGASTGTLTIMASGPRVHFDRVKPALDAMGTKIFHVGEQPGQGESMKAINQILAGVHLIAAAEALSMAKATGVDPALALEIVKGSAAGSWMLSNRAHRMLEEHPQCRSSIQTWSKDYGIILETGRTSGAALPLSAIAAQMWNSAMARGQAQDDDSTVIRQYDFLNGNDLRSSKSKQ